MKYKIKKFPLNIFGKFLPSLKNAIVKNFNLFGTKSKEKIDRKILFTFLLSLPALLIWVFSLVAYIWQYFVTNWFSKLSPQVYLIVLLLMPFVAFNFSLWHFYKTNDKRYKKLSMVNLVLLVLIIAASFVFST